MKSDKNIFIICWDALVGPELTDVKENARLDYGYFTNEEECRLVCDQLTQRNELGIVYYPNNIPYRLDIFTQSKHIPLCHKCSYSIKQTDLFAIPTRAIEISGCTKMNKDIFDNYEQRIKHCVAIPKELNENT